MSQKSINVSATTAIDLKAQIAQHTEQFEKQRSVGKHGPARKVEKKPTVWQRQNKGLAARSKRDELEAVQTDVLVRSREQLEKKAQIYEKMKAGEYDPEDDEILVDFDRKYLEEKERSSGKRKRKDGKDEDDDPWVEYEDEFGRTRVVRRSQVPSRSPSRSPSPEPGFSMPRPSYERDDESGDIDEMDHYEADREIRTKGVGFYHFSKDEESRADQLAKLNKLRQETEQARQSATSASDKRKAMLAKNADKIKARRAALQAKKHQLKPEEVPKDINVDQVNEDSVNMFLQSIRSKFE